jgi:hypothetical protein
MNAFGVTCLGHNIPRLLREGSSTMCAVRVQNTRDRDVHFQSHASFYTICLSTSTGCLPNPFSSTMTAYAQGSVRRCISPFTQARRENIACSS